LRPDADYELWFQDEAEFHLHPYLTAMWMLRGHQKRVPAPGRNRKVAVFGAWGYGHGLFRYHTQPRKNAWGVRLLVRQLVQRARRTGRRILLVMDQGNPHHAKALLNDLHLVTEHVRVFWLPHYSPELNLIGRLWKHLKRSRLATVLFRRVPQFLGHVAAVLTDFALHPDLTLSIVARQGHERIRKKKLVAA
jgi:transposase